MVAVYNYVIHMYMYVYSIRRNKTTQSESQNGHLNESEPAEPDTTTEQVCVEIGSAANNHTEVNQAERREAITNFGGPTESSISLEQSHISSLKYNFSKRT